MSSEEQTQDTQIKPATDWGTSGLNTFLPSHHSKVYAAIDPSQVKLPPQTVCCVVGASRGIGAGIAYAYAQAGCSGLILASRKRSGMEETAARCRAVRPGLKTVILECDITLKVSVAGLAATAEQEFGQLNIVTVNSGYSGPVVLDLADTDPETFQRASSVNYVGTFLCAKYLIPLILKAPGGIRDFIAVSSFASFIVRGPIANTQYCVSKLAQLKLMEHIHEQYHDQGLAAYSVQPGAVASEMALETAPKEFLEYLIDSPDLCGAFCVWLSRNNGKRWLSGRIVAANWDVDELSGKKNEVVEKDLLKAKVAL